MSSPLTDGPSGSAEPIAPAARPHRYRGVHRAPRTPVRRALLVGVLAVVVGVAATLMLVRPWDDAAGADDADPALAGIGTDVAEWLGDEVPGDTAVAASDDVREALVTAGAGDRVGGSSEGALQVVEGEPVADALVLARFESDDGAVLSIVDPDPGRPTAAELERRQSLGAAVLANPVAGVTGRGAELLRTGDVDARLLGLLAGLVSRMDVHVADLPPAPGEPADGPPARRLLVDEAGGERLTPGAEATEDLVAFLEAQRPPFAPDTVEPTDGGLLVGFDYVSAPDALVSAATP